MATGNICKITRKNKEGHPSVRYRYRQGRGGSSTFFMTLKAAQEHQKAVERATKERGSDSLKVLDKTTLGHVTASLELLESIGLSSEHLLQACRGYTASLSEHALTVTLGEAVEMAMETPRFKRLKPSTVKNYAYRWRRLVEAVDASKPLGAVSVAEVEQFIYAQTDKSQGKYYTDLHVLFGVFFVRQLRLLTENLTDKVVPPENTNSERREPYSYHEVVTFLEGVEPYSDLDVLLHLSLFTGMRTSEVCGLTHDMINVRKENIYLPFGFAKNKMDRFVDIPEALFEVLQRAGVGTGVGNVINTPYRRLREQLRGICEAQNVPFKGVTSRITFISHAYEGLFKKELPPLQNQVGHSLGSEVTLRHYLNAVDTDEAKQYFMLPIKRVDETLWADLVAPV